MTTKGQPLDEAVQPYSLGNESQPYEMPMYLGLDKGRVLLPADYGLEEELLDHVERLPDAERVSYVVTNLPAKDLRQLGIGVLNGSVLMLKRMDFLTFAKLFNSWFATAEETVAGGSKRHRILARRRATGNK